MKTECPQSFSALRGCNRVFGSFLLLLAVLSLALPGCRPRKPSDHVGVYALESINGNKLPFTPPPEGRAPEIQSGSITLNADGNFNSTMTFRLPGGKVNSRDSRGTYTRDGAAFHLAWTGAGATTATFDGNILTIDDQGLKCAYRK